MDSFLESARIAGRAPFDGLTLSLTDLVAIETMQPLVAAAVEILSSRFGASGLRSLADWHEHDGFVSVSKPASWRELRTLVASAEALHSLRESDDRVRSAFYETGGAFLLRIHVPDDDDGESPGRHGEFDVTTWSDVVADIDRKLPRGVAIIAPARAYFDKRWAG